MSVQDALKSVPEEMHDEVKKEFFQGIAKLFETVATVTQFVQSGKVEAMIWCTSFRGSCSSFAENSVIPGGAGGWPKRRTDMLHVVKSKEDKNREKLQWEADQGNVAPRVGSTPIDPTVGGASSSYQMRTDFVVGPDGAAKQVQVDKDAKQHLSGSTKNT